MCPLPKIKFLSGARAQIFFFFFLKLRKHAAGHKNFLRKKISTSPYRINSVPINPRLFPIASPVYGIALYLTGVGMRTPVGSVDVLSFKFSGANCEREGGKVNEKSGEG